MGECDHLIEAPARTECEPPCLFPFRSDRHHEKTGEYTVFRLPSYGHHTSYLNVVNYQDRWFSLLGQQDNRAKGP